MKKMNNLFKKDMLVVTVVTMASCDFLDTKPYDFVAPETFYQNEKRLCNGLGWSILYLGKRDRLR